MAKSRPSRLGVPLPSRDATSALGTQQTEVEIALALHEHIERVRLAVRGQGWAIQPIVGAIPYCYTVGLSLPSPSRDRQSEVLLAGLEPGLAAPALDHVARCVLEGRLVPAEGPEFGEVFAGRPARFRRMAGRHAAAALRLAAALDDDRVRVAGWQLLWPDLQGRFPGDAGCVESVVRAQDLDTVLAVELQQG